MEVTGSNRGRLLDPKYDLLTNHQDIVIPSLEREAEKLLKGGTKRYNKASDGFSRLSQG